jgi:hypothetical protein
MTQPRRPPYDPANFAPEPARDARFDVKEQWVDCHNPPEGDPEREVEFFHRQMNEEINGMECAARALADFPDAEWGVRMSIARQCYDEARHVEMFRRIFERRGGRVGQYPVLNFQNRTFETGGIDAVQVGINDASSQGDLEQAALYDAQLADEITHVRFANEYLSSVSARDPASIMRVGRALNYASGAFFQVMGHEAINAVDYPVDEQGRLDAGFSADEVRHAVDHLAAQKAKKT